LDEEDRCRVHSVSPYGCSHFDAHQTMKRRISAAALAITRSTWHGKTIISTRDSGFY
jgi:hypothetical protein